MSASRLLTMVNESFSDQLSVTDRGLAFGDGLFETMRFTGGRIPLLGYHLERLEAGCLALGIPVTRASIESSLHTFIAALSSHESLIIKLIVTRGSGGQGCRPPILEETIPTVILQGLPLVATARQAQTGVVLQSCPLPLYPTPYLAGIKHLNRLNYVMAAQGLSESPDVQGLLLDDQGNLLESLHHNVFFVKDQKLLTPQLGNAGVKGVLRRVILERLASACSIPVCEGEFPVETLLLADEVFLTNSVRGIWPVNAFTTRRWQVPGLVTQRLQSMVDEIFAEASFGDAAL